MGVADLRAAGPGALARRFVGALDRPRVGGEVPDARESPDVVDNVEDGHGQGLAGT